jgi:hypothetical protein
MVTTDNHEWCSEYLGSDRPYQDGVREADVRLVESFSYHDGHGRCFRFSDLEGHCLVWFTKRERDIQTGQTYRVSFVIQSHREFNGVRENITKKFRILAVHK